MSTATPAGRSLPGSAQTESRLAHFPITFFGVTMGVFGLALALRAGGFALASGATTVAGAVLLVVLFAIYALKAQRYPAQVAGEWSHPVKLSFFPAANISVLLLSLLLQASQPALSAILWSVGAIVQAILTVVIISAWISHRPFGPAMLSPAWFIPAVANVIVPLGGLHLGLVDVSWYFFSVGVLFWLVLLTLVFNRLIFHDPLPGKLRPTLMILIAPPSVAFLAWTELNGGTPDALAHIFLSVGVFFAALVAVQVPSLLRLPFAMSFWALSFPLAALTTGMFRFGAMGGAQGYRVAGFVLLALLVLTILALAVRTFRAALAGDICQPE
jgi:tellurite resistance protein